ncbi:MAG: phosphatase PAP2 family protein [Trichloromonadaceae bacterium]
MAATDNLRLFADYYARHITPWEAELMQRFCRLRRLPLLTLLFRTASRLGDGPFWGVCALLLGVFGGLAERLAVAAGLLAALASVALFMAVKNLIGRPRPCDAWSGVTSLMAAPDRFSFPSGHTMTAFAVFAAFAPILPASVPVFLPLAVLIGLSRVFLGLHYPTDVLVGAVLGSSMGHLASLVVMEMAP